PRGPRGCLEAPVRAPGGHLRGPAAPHRALGGEGRAGGGGRAPPGRLRAPRGPAHPSLPGGRLPRAPRRRGGRVSNAVEVEKLSKVFGDFVAVDAVSFAVEAGEVFGFLGPNGAGKTTTIKMLTGLVPPSSGRGTVAGLDILRQGKEI